MKRRFHQDHSAAGEAVTELMLEVFRLNGSLLAAGDKLVAPIGLTSARWQVLGAIAMSGRPQPVAHIARDMGLARQSVQRVANDLQAAGLVAFVANPHHRRAKLVVLTARGRRAYDAAIERHVGWSNALAEGLSTREINRAVQQLTALRARIEQDKD